MKSLDNKIYKENSKKDYLRDLAMNETINFRNFNRVYEEIDKTNNKLKFLKNLKKELEKIENDKNNSKINLR